MNWLSYLARQLFPAESTEREALIPIQISDVRFSPWLWSLENSSARNIRSLFAVWFSRDNGGSVVLRGGPTPLRAPSSACVPHGRDQEKVPGLEDWSDVSPPSSSHLRALHRRAHTPLHELLISSERARIHCIVACLSCLSRSGCVQRSWRSGFRGIQMHACALGARRMWAAWVPFLGLTRIQLPASALHRLLRTLGPDSSTDLLMKLRIWRTWM